MPILSLPAGVLKDILLDDIVANPDWVKKRES